MGQNRIDRLGGRWKYYLLFGVGILLALTMLIGGEGEEKQTVAQPSSGKENVAAEERKVKYLLEEMQSVEDASVMLMTDDDGNVSGIAVVCRNGEDPNIQEKIIRSLRALFGLGSHQISVSG